MGQSSWYSVMIKARCAGQGVSAWCSVMTQRCGCRGVGEAQEGRDICTYRAASHCTAETTMHCKAITLQLKKIKNHTEKHYILYEGEKSLYI